MAEEFKVVLDGVELPPEQRVNISKAIQHVVLSHLAELDLRGDKDAAFIVRGHTQGIWVVPRPLEDLKGAVPESLLRERE